MKNSIYLVILCPFLFACSSVQKIGLKTSKHTRVIQYEPAVKEDEHSFYQFEDENYYYAFYLLPKEQKEAQSTLQKITTNIEQKIEINYHKSGGQACLKSVKIEGKTFDMLDVSNRCDLYVSSEKTENSYNHLRQDKPKLTHAKIKQFLRKNSSLKEYEPLIVLQTIKPGMPVKLLYFMWGQPESKVKDEDQSLLMTYSDWYVEIRDNKIFSFSSRDKVIDFSQENNSEDQL